MNEKNIKEVILASFDEAMKEKLEPMIGAIAAEKALAIVNKMKEERSLLGSDMSGLSESTKSAFVEVARSAGYKGGKFQIDTKANEALVEEQDNRGGYLVSPEVAAAIMRIAASVGTILSQATKWPMKSDELAIPNYTGAFLTGSYIGVDVAGTVQGLTFGQAILIAKKWQLAFAVGNDLLADASVNLADWLLALAGESLANMIDQQGFVGTGAPFVGVLNNSNVQTYIAGGSSSSGSTTFAKFDVMVDSSAMIGLLEESVLDGAGFYMHRTVWASLRSQKGTDGLPILLFGGLATPATLQTNVGGGPVKPAGQIFGYPVYTNRWLPAKGGSLDTNNSPFLIFGNMKATAFGDKGEMEVAQFESGTFGGKEVALADQRGIVYRHRHAFAIVLPQAFVVCSTSNS